MSATEQQQTMTPEQRLSHVTARRDELYAETVRLKNKCTDLTKENERLRKVLEELKADAEKATVLSGANVHRVCCAALEGKETP